MKPSDQDPDCFPPCLEIHAYNWNAAGWGGGGSVVHKIFQQDKG